MRLHIRFVEFLRWFPFDDPLAPKIARLCIIREDLIMETNALKAIHIEALDKRLGEEVRHVYFFRNVVRSLHELSGTIATLLSDKHFRELVERHSLQNEFKRIEHARQKLGYIVKDIRDDICGHVRERAVQAALQRMAEREPDKFGLLQLSSTLDMKVAHEIVAEILLKDVSEEERLAFTAKKYAEIYEFMDPMLGIIERCLKMYLKDRGFGK